jgi:excisionase family DNA binding protein
MTEPLEPVYTVTQVAEWLQCSNNQVTQLATKHNWPHLRVGNRLRFTQTHLTEILNRLQTTPTTEQPRTKIGSRSRAPRNTK